MRFGVVTFPGTHGEQDVAHALRHLGQQADCIWHEDPSVSDYDALVLPGGSSYGDYIRPGALAAVSPAMESVKEFARSGKPVIGIANGFHILIEAGLLPGAIIQNKNLKFECRTVPVRVEDSVCQWVVTKPGSVIDIPIAHSHGNYICDEETLKNLNANNQIVLRYANADGTDLDPQFSPNGSVENIAGICNKEGNVFGLMPQPERAVDGINGGLRDGCSLLMGIVPAAHTK